MYPFRVMVNLSPIVIVMCIGVMIPVVDGALSPKHGLISHHMHLSIGLRVVVRVVLLCCLVKWSLLLLLLLIFGVIVDQIFVFDYIVNIVTVDCARVSVDVGGSSEHFAL